MNRLLWFAIRFSSMTIYLALDSIGMKITTNFMNYWDY